MSAPNPAAVTANARAMSALQAGDYPAAIAGFEQACAADPGSGPLRRNLASAHRAAGDDQAELAALEAALAIDRRDLVAWMRKAEVHQKRGEKGPALQAWSGAIQLAEPLRPWSGPLQLLLEQGQRFVDDAAVELRAATDAALAPIQASLDPMEDRRGRAFVDIALGGRKHYTNECAGLFYPFLPADEHKLSWSACFLYEYGAPNSPVLDRCPATAKALAAIPKSAIPGRSPNAFFSILQPQTRIPPHTGVSNTRAIVHLPLVVPPGCGFRVGGETRQWEVGRPFAFDDTIEHEAWNDSDEMRAVLICDVWNPHLTPREQQLITEYYRASDEAGYSSATSE
jgi:hypothetical protein